MRKRIYKAYDAVTADAAQCRAAQTAALAALQVKHSHTPHVRRWVTVTAAIALIAAVAVGYAVYTQPVAMISIEGDTTVELQVNRFDRVVAVETENEQETVAPRFSRYTDAVQAVADGGNVAQVTVFSQEDARCEVMVEHLQNESGETCRAGDADVIEQAAQSGLPCGKYEAFLQWQALDPEATVEDARTMTMREIREAIAALSDEAQDDDAAEDTAESAVQSQNCGQGHGQGKGHGNGKQKGKQKD